MIARGPERPHTISAESTPGSGWWVPTPDEALALMRREEVPERVIEHVSTVLRLAEIASERAVSAGIEHDTRLVLAGAVLHDLGRSRRHDLLHAVVGSELANGHGCHPSLVSIIRRHIGAGITEDEAQQHGLPLESYLPQSFEERLVSAVDNLVGGVRYRTRDQAAETFRRKDLQEAAQRVEALHDEVSGRLGIDLDQLLPEQPPDSAGDQG